MIKNNPKYIGYQRLILVLALAALFCSLPELTFCETAGPALLLQQIPAEGGKIIPGTGVHYIELNTSVTLTAVPEPGYEFVYWLGDVTDPKLKRTTAYLNAPKIIVAVFERAEFELEGVADVMIPSGFWGRLSRSAADYSRQGYSGGGGAKPSERAPARRPPQPPPPPDFPVPIPEPATAVLLALGSFLAFAVRKNSQGGRRTKK
jgi:hypothetical protein